jgi:hypothetical protein
MADVVLGKLCGSRGKGVGEHSPIPAVESFTGTFCGIGGANSANIYRRHLLTLPVVGFSITLCVAPIQHCHPSSEWLVSAWAEFPISASWSFPPTTEASEGGWTISGSTRMRCWAGDFKSKKRATSASSPLAAGSTTQAAQLTGRVAMLGRGRQRVWAFTRRGVSAFFPPLVQQMSCVTRAVAKERGN